jgi:hypothetical protein
MPDKTRSTKDESLACEVCGRPLCTKPGPGRPPSYHPECRQMARLIAWTFSAIEQIRPHLSARGRERLGRTFDDMKAVLNDTDDE